MSDQNADSRKQAANYKGPKLQYIDLFEPFESPPNATNRLGSPEWVWESVGLSGGWQGSCLQRGNACKEGKREEEKRGGRVGEEGSG